MATITHSGNLPNSADKADFYAIIDNATLSSVVNDDVGAGAAIADTKLATISTANKVNTDALIATSNVQGDTLYHNGTKWTRLGAGTNGYFLKTQGASADPTWAVAGKINQVVYTIDGGSATGATAIPWDNTIPTTAEGVQFMSAAISPVASANYLKVEGQINCNVADSGDNIISALFQDDVCVGVSMVHSDDTNTDYPIYSLPISYIGVAGTTASSVFTLRAGAEDTSKFTFNGNNSSGKMGGKLNSSLIISEILA